MSFLVVATEPRWLTEAMVMAIHAQQVERYGGRHGVLDENTVLSALGRPRQRWAYDRACDYADLVAAYLVGLGRSQGFSDGNKRTALACALVFLSLNGLALHVPASEVLAITMAVATGQAGDADVASWLRPRIARRT